MDFTRRWAAVAVLVAGAMLGAACTTGAGGGSGIPNNTTPLGANCTQPPQIFAGADLAGCLIGAVNLSGRDLTGINLRGANLAGANLSGANLTDADLSSANLTGADLTGANLTRANLSGALLFAALLIGAILFRTTFGDSPIPTFRSGYGGGAGAAAPADGVGAGSQSWNDRGEPWCGSNMHPNWAADNSRSVRTNGLTSFVGAHFTSNDIRGLDLRAGDFTGATIDFLDSPWWGCLAMTGGHFQNTTWINLSTNNWDMTNADFRGATFIHGTMCRGDLSGSDLSGAQFIGGFDSTRCVNVSDPAWSGPGRWTVKFNAANLTGARFGGNDALASQYASSQYGSGPWMVSFGYSEWDPVTSTSTLIGGPDFRSAVLSGASFDSVNMDQGDFNGATTTGLTSGNDPYGSSWRQTVFGPGWTSSTWTGSHDFTDATCPDGSTGSYATPCF